MANPTQSDPAADQAAAALYAEQYQQYTQQVQAYQAWLAANPGYQQPGIPAPASSTAAPDYSAYYQQYATQPATAALTQAQPQQALNSEEYAQQYAAYYAQYNSAQATSSSAPPSTGAPAAAAAPYNGHAAYHDYYAQQGHQPYTYPASAAPGVQAHQHQYPGYQTSAPGTQQAPAAPNQGPPGQNGNYSKPYPAHANSSHSGYQSGYQGKQHWNSKPNNQPPFDNQAFQKQKHLEAEQRQKRAREEQDKVHIQQKLHTTTLNDDGYSGQNGANMSKLAHEKPAYLSVKSKKTKPLTTNALETKESSGAASSSEGWPQSLKDYVQRVFETIADEERDVAQKDLRDMVSKYHSDGTLWDIEWEKMNVPNKYKTKKDKERERASRKLSDSPEPTTAGEEETRRREKRQRRFLDARNDVVPKKTKPVYTAPVFNSDVIDWDEYTIVGTSTQLEKNYLRLTSAPDPATVRPVRVLQKTLDLLKEKWRKDQNYAYICDQFKSVRQDLTVQRIKSEFTVTVYEIHARIALEKGDLGEYNQCQTQLKQLYEYNLQGHVMEFTAYRILYLLHTRNPSDIIAMLASLTPAQKHDPAVKHALKVRTALASSNYHALFKLYISAPNMGGYLMDQFVERERVEAMKMICKAYRPNIEVSFLRSTLGFVDELECMGFLKAIGVVPYLNQDSGPGKKRYQFLDTKAALPYVLEAGKKYQTVDIKGQI
ncbi:hypothetical protein BG015_004751 [Linnemannia schmuckeri]|uniref:PCI domain-containing protein n=1 Tax=Linnemannia schmuckeri TaxID=64567 RepID=A0A9P5S1H1_9FUNG|nr:hypothetical protein BG015_004751 [Linnemannia schmuckeri]